MVDKMQHLKGHNMGEIVEVSFKETVSGKVLTCRFVLQIEVIENGEDLKLVSQDNITDDYKEAIDFAVECFKSIFWKKHPNCGGIITIFRMNAYAVDTRSMVTFYVLLSALCKAIGIELPGLELSKEQGVFMIPATL